MSKWKEQLLNKGFSLGMDVFQKAMGHPKVGPLLLRSMSQGFEFKDTLEKKREQLLSRMHIASFQEQEELRSHVGQLERKIERLEKRLRELNAQARRAEMEAAQQRAQDTTRQEADSPSV